MPGKAINYNHFKKYLCPELGYDFQKVRDELIKLKDMSELELTDEMKAVREAYFKNKYEEACISQKLDMLSEDVIRLVHQNADNLLVKDGIPPHCTSLIQSMMKRESERANLILRYEELKLKRELLETAKNTINVNQLSIGFIPPMEEMPSGDEPKQLE